MSLPIFNPKMRDTSNTSGGTPRHVSPDKMGDTWGIRQEMGTTSNKTGDTSEKPSGIPRTTSDELGDTSIISRDTSGIPATYPQRVHDLKHDMNHDDDDKTHNLKNEKVLNENTLNPEEYNRYQLLLNVHTRIPGYTGRAMDAGEALNLARGYTLEHIEQGVDTLIKRIKTGGKPVIKPIAYLHRIITENIQSDPEISGHTFTNQAQQLSYNRSSNRKKPKYPVTQTTLPLHEDTKIGHYDTEMELEIDTITEGKAAQIQNDVRLKKMLTLHHPELNNRLGKVAVENGKLMLVFWGSSAPEGDNPDWLTTAKLLYPSVTEIERI